MKKLLVAGIVIVAGAAAATPYFIGQKAKERFALSHEWLQQELVYPQLTAEAGEFKEGWLKSETSTDFTFTPPKEGAEAIHFTVVHHIDQIPSLGEGALMSVDSELVLPDDVAAKLKEYFKDKPLLSAHTVVNFDGSENSTITSPRYVGPLKGEENLHLDWQGLEGTINSDGQMRHITASLSAPGLSFEDEEGKVTVSQLNYNTDLVRGMHDLWFGTAGASMEQMELDVETPENGPTRMQMSKARLTTEQREDDTRVDIDGMLTFDTIEVNGFSVSDGVYDVAYHNLDAASLGQLNSSLKQIMHEQPQDPSLLFAGMMPHIQGLLSQKPELAIRQLQVETPMGTVSGKLHMALTDVLSDAVMQDPTMLMDIVKIDLDASLPKPMVMGILSSSATKTIMQVAKAQGQELSAEELAEQSSALMQQQLQGLMAQQLMVEEGDNYATSIHYNQQKLMINDQDATPMISALLQ